MAQFKFALYALLLELEAWAQMLMPGERTDAVLLGFLATHALASAVLATGALWLVPRTYAPSRRAAWLLFFVVACSVPALGILGILMALVIAPHLSAQADGMQYKALALPDLDPHERHDSAAFRQAGLRQFLRNGRAPVDSRLKALVALQNAPVQFSSPLLHDLLGDSTEDLRLLAYGMLETREKKLNARISQARGELEGAPDAQARRTAAAQLSGLYWELIYQGLVHGDLRRHAANEALRYLEIALDGADDAGLHLSHGRLLHELGRNEEARAAYRRAWAMGIPAPRVVPYLAELAFEQHHYQDVIQLLGSLRDYRNSARLEPLLRFWRIQ